MSSLRYAPKIHIRYEFLSQNLLKNLVNTVFFAHGQRDKKLHPPGEGG